jgi:uncharacterized membrane protein YdfJ with MMPL/SSD domain
MIQPKHVRMTDVMSAHDDRQGPPRAPQPGPLGRLGGLAYRRRGTVLIAWAVALAIAFGLSAAFGGEFANDSSVPGSDSAQAQSLLAERFGGRAVQLAETNQSGSEMIGLLAAAVILLIMFGSVVAAGLPLAMAIGGLAVSSSLVGLAATAVDVPSFAPIIGMTLGIALGIDYALLMVTRFREWRAAGLDPEAAAAATLDTAGRSVLVAAGTVMVSMLGLFAVGLPAMNGTAVATMVATLVVMVAAITLFPALLGYLGRHIDRLRVPLGRHRPTQISADGHLMPAAGWTRWSRLVQRHRVPAAGTSVALLLALAAPFLGVHFGLPDQGNDPKNTSSRQAYDMLAKGFGPGTNGPLLLVADTSHGGGPVVQRLQAALSSTAGMDYEVFLISRMREAWVRTQDNRQAITTGLASTGRVITAAAAIMIVVFASLIPSDQVFIKVAGVGMVAAILVDAAIIRMLLLPAVMHLLGAATGGCPAAWPGACLSCTSKDHHHVRTPPRWRGARPRCGESVAVYRSPPVFTSSPHAVRAGFTTA